MTARDDLDGKARTWNAIQKADGTLRLIEGTLNRSPRAIAMETLEWLEGRAIDGELAPNGPLRDYNVQDVLARAHGKTPHTLRPKR